MIRYLVYFLIGWTVVGAIFTLFVWPMIVTKLNKYYPILHSNDADNL